MFKPLFTLAMLFLLSTPGECTTEDVKTATNLAESMSNESIIDMVTLVLTEKVNHYQTLTDVVKSLATSGGLSMGDSCLSHHIYLFGAGGITNTVVSAAGEINKYLGATSSDGTVKGAAQNYTEGAVSGLLGVVKTDVYVLKQIVDTSKKILDGVSKLDSGKAEDVIAMALARKAQKTEITTLTEEEKTAHEKEIKAFKEGTNEAITALKSSLTTIKTEVEGILKANIHNAMRVLPGVEDAIFAYAIGNSVSNKAFNISTDTDDTNAKTTGSNVAKLAKDTSDMIKTYFELVTSEAGLAKINKVSSSDNNSKGTTTEEEVDSTKFTTMKTYQDAFVAYVAAIAPDAATLKNAAAPNTLGNAPDTEKTKKLSSAAGITPGDANSVGKTLSDARKKYTELEGTTLTDGAAASAIICGRKNLTKLLPQKNT